MYTALLERRHMLQQQLTHKLQQLRKICLQEAVCIFLIFKNAHVLHHYCDCFCCVVWSSWHVLL